MKTKNAKFWHYSANGGYVKIKIKPGQVLCHHSGGRTDEGSSWEGHRWEHEGNIIREEETHWGRDCDGGYRRCADYVCPMGKLAVNPAYSDKKILTPEWKTEREWQRDESAERMGY